MDKFVDFLSSLKSLLLVSAVICGSFSNAENRGQSKGFLGNVKAEIFGGAFIASGHIAPGPDSYKSEMNVLSVGSNLDVVWKSTVDSALGIKVIVGKSVGSQFDGLVFVVQKMGALAENMEVIARKENSVVTIFESDATIFEFVKINNRKLLVGHMDVNLLDVPTLIDFVDGRMVDVSEKYSSYYLRLLSTLPFSWDSVPVNAQAAFVALVKKAKQEDVVRRKLILKLQQKNLSDERRSHLAELSNLFTNRGLEWAWRNNPDERRTRLPPTRIPSTQCTPNVLRGRGRRIHSSWKTPGFPGPFAAMWCPD